MKARVNRCAALALLLSLLLAAPAMAQGDHDNGEGLLGELNDRIITFLSLIHI